MSPIFSCKEHASEYSHYVPSLDTLTLEMRLERETLQPKEKKGMSIYCTPARLWALGELHFYGKSSPPEDSSMSWVLGSRVGGGKVCVRGVE